jgi:hypothetical protein
MNVKIGTVVEQYLFWEYFFHFFGIGSFQCKPEHLSRIHYLKTIGTDPLAPLKGLCDRAKKKT